MPALGDVSLMAAIGLFIGAAAVIGVAGVRLAALADRLADRTGLGEAVSGALFLGASTSLPGIVTSVTAASGGHAELAVSNALGGIAAQAAFLGVADLAYPKANLEHAAASAANIMQGTLLVTLLSLSLLAAMSPEVSVWGVHPVTPLVLATYLYGMQMVSQAHTVPMWRPRWTPETREDTPERQADQRGMASLWLRFVLFAGILGFSGWTVARTGIIIAARTGLSETIVGGMFTAISTSLPELVTAIAAVRRGALTLAVSDIIGGNAFDTLFIAIADLAYRRGSIYHAVSQRQIFLMALTMLLTGILLMGLIRRERRGIANIGFESFFILVFYGGAMLLLFHGDGP